MAYKSQFTDQEAGSGISGAERNSGAGGIHGSLSTDARRRPLMPEPFVQKEVGLVTT